MVRDGFRGIRSRTAENWLSKGMIRIPVKPLSVNRSYQGSRFATPESKAYKEALGYLLPPLTIPPGKLAVKYEFGVSSKVADGDHLIKSFQEYALRKVRLQRSQYLPLGNREEDCAQGERICGFRDKGKTGLSSSGWRRGWGPRFT
jgi:hypothetical protein